MTARVLTVAGSDPSGGAGVQADMKTFAAFGCFGMAVISALTAQDTTGVRGVHAPPAAFVGSCLDALLDDCPPAAVKTGMLFDGDVIDRVAVALRSGAAGPLVVDPVMVATSGDALLRPDAERAIRERLLPIAALVTPNAHEAARLTGIDVISEGDAIRAGEALLELGAAAALVKGGHVPGDVVTDVLVCRDGPRVTAFRRPRILGVSSHGCGCTLSAAVAAGLARGDGLRAAVSRAGDFVHAAIAASRPTGRGATPLDHLVLPPGGGARW